MTPEQLDLVAATIPSIERDPDRLTAAFFGQLPAEIRRLLPPTSPVELTALGTVVADLPTFVDRARSLGGRCHRAGVRTDHYELVERALLAALADVVGGAWDEATSGAWQRLYCLASEAMQETRAVG